MYKREKWLIVRMFIVERMERRPRMGRVQGGARAAFATPSWGPSCMTFIWHFSKNHGAALLKKSYLYTRKFKIGD